MADQPIDVDVKFGMTEIKMSFGIETRQNENQMIEYRKVIRISGQEVAYGAWEPWTFAPWVEGK